MNHNRGWRFARGGGQSFWGWGTQLDGQEDSREGGLRGIIFETRQTMKKWENVLKLDADTHPIAFLMTVAWMQETFRLPNQAR